MKFWFLYCYSKASELFTSSEEQLQFTEDYDFDLARAVLLERLGRYSDAAELHLAEGRTLEGIQLLLRDPTQRTSVLWGQECILHGLWQRVSFGMDLASVQSDQNFHQLLKLSEQILSSSLEGIDRNEVSHFLNMTSARHLEHSKISMFKAISTGSMPQLQRLGAKFYDSDNIAATLLCLENVFNKVAPHLQAASISEVAETLGAFVKYARLLRRLGCDPDPSDNPSVQKLFAFQSASNDTLLVPANTFLHRQLKNDQVLTQKQDESILIPKWDLSEKFRKYLNGHLCKKVEDVDWICWKTQAFEPCLQHLIAGRCSKAECSRAHFDLSELTRSFYNTRVQIHLQILALRTLSFNARSQRCVGSFLNPLRIRLMAVPVGFGLPSFTKRCTHNGTL
jgi:hypothetical protein